LVEPHSGSTSSREAAAEVLVRSIQSSSSEPSSLMSASSSSVGSAA
jgi:hypothetical protein